MKFRWVILLVILIFSIVGESFAAELSKINLNDGSVISGELISLDLGVYTIKTPSLGKIMVKSSEIKSIRNQTESNKNGSSTSRRIPAGQISSLQQQLMSNEEIMKMIFSLQNDPTIQKSLQDPELMKALNSGDINTLQNNPLFNEILKNSTIQQIQRKSMGK